MSATPASIGIVLHDFALGGTERIALRLARAWAARGVAVTIFCGSTDGPLGMLAGPDVEIVAADPPIARSALSRQRLARFAAECFRQRRIEACFIPGNYHWSVIPALRSLPPPHRPFILAQVSASLDKPQRGRWRQLAFDRRMRRLLSGADRVVTLAESMRRDADRILFRRVAVALPLPALEDEAPPLSPVPPGNRTILAAGRLVPIKGYATLIRAFAMIDDPAARLVIVGAGPNEARLRRLIDELDLGNRVDLPGLVGDTRPWLDEARLLVLSSQFEGFPAVVVEALAAGRQVIATDCTPATRELLTGPEFGRVVPIDDAPSLALALREVLASAPPPPALLAAAVAHFRIGPVADAYLQSFG
ncbi:glycosyltransferase [Glacieibacterium sp.]|uniref:glycosyltransferase n=1 Tax=Glacieibacterium sp. TaxID=2860237 RepID=UPI003B00EBA4